MRETGYRHGQRYGNPLAGGVRFTAGNANRERPSRLNLDAGPSAGYILRQEPVDHDQLLATRRPGDQPHRCVGHVELLREKPEKGRVRQAADGGGRNPGLEHAVVGDSVDPARTATRRQPHGKSGRGMSAVWLAAVGVHVGPIIAAARRMTT